MGDTMLRLLAVVLGSFALRAEDADLILHNGKIVTVDKQFSIQQAVAVRSGMIVAVAPDTSILHEQRGPKTKLIDLHGRTVLPSLVDAHLPAPEPGLSEDRAPLPPRHSL